MSLCIPNFLDKSIKTLVDFKVIIFFVEHFGEFWEYFGKNSAELGADWSKVWADGESNIGGPFLYTSSKFDHFGRFDCFIGNGEGGRRNWARRRLWRNPPAFEQDWRGRQHTQHWVRSKLASALQLRGNACFPVSAYVDFEFFEKTSRSNLLFLYKQAYQYVISFLVKISVHDVWFSERKNHEFTDL